MAHVRKRQFRESSQSSITSFFSPVASVSSGPSSTNIPEAAPSLKPVLSDHVQSLLINVGMRVRKSVPEGYKTHKTMPTPTMTYMHPSSLTANNNEPSNSAPELYSKPSELAPFCGLHKIGGHSSQPTLSFSQSTAPSLSLSQSTAASSVMAQTPKQTRKRSYSDDIEDELDNYFSPEKEIPHDNVAISPKSRYPVSHSCMPNLGAESGFVKAKSRPKARIKIRSPVKGTAISSHDDFADDDVGFLQPMDCD